MSRSKPIDADLQRPEPHPDDWGPRTFEKVGFAAYRLSVPRAFLTFDLSRLRRHSQELFGELAVKCELPGAKTFEGILSAGDFNCSSVQARSTRAKLLAARAMTRDIDFEGYLEELCLRVLQTERSGEPAQVLRDVEVTDEMHGEFEVLGLKLPKRHPSILFGDGGSAKSLMSLQIACTLAQAGEVVMYCDWEATAQDHKVRLDLLYPDDPPAVLYVRCEQPLTVEADRLRNLAVEFGITYCILDSAAYGCGGAPESAEVALDYFRALRSMGQIGSLLIAHVTKSEEGDKRPFGSGFWHNSARATWHIKRNNPEDDGPEVVTLISPRKANFGKLGQPMSFAVRFGTTITIERCSILAAPEFAPSLSVGQRMMAMLREAPMTRDSLNSEFADTKRDTMKRIINRGVQSGRLIRFQNVEGHEVIGIKH